MAHELVISVLTPDRVGLIAGVTQAVYAAGGNISAISQTVLQGYFTIVFTAALPDDCVPAHLQHAIEAIGGSGGELSVLVRRRAPAGTAPATPSAGDHFILTFSGPDQPGILARITAYLASRSINIEDLAAHTDQARFLVLGEVVLPAGEDMRQVLIDLNALMTGDDQLVTLQHVNIFAATTEIAFRHITRSTR